MQMEAASFSELISGAVWRGQYRRSRTRSRPWCAHPIVPVINVLSATRNKAAIAKPTNQASASNFLSRALRFLSFLIAALANLVHFRSRLLPPEESVHLLKRIERETQK